MPQSMMNASPHGLAAPSPLNVPLLRDHLTRCAAHGRDAGLRWATALWLGVVPGGLLGLPIPALADGPSSATNAAPAAPAQPTRLSGDATRQHATAVTKAPPGYRLPLADAFAAAWARDLAATQALGLRDVAQADQHAADAWLAAPAALELSHSSDRLQDRMGRHDLAVGVALPLWLPGQQQARQGLAQARLRQAEATELASRLALADRLRQAAWAVLARRAEQQQAELQVQLLQNLASDVRRRVHAGDLARADALAADAELLAAQQQQTQATLRTDDALSRWQLLTGLTSAPAREPVTSAQTPWAPDLRADLAPATPPVHAPPPAQALQDVATVLTQHPELLQAQAAIVSAQHNLALVLRSPRTTPELSIGVRQEQPGRGAESNNSLRLGLRWPLADESRNRPALAAANQQLTGVQAQARQTQSRLMLALQQAERTLALTRQQHQLEQQRASLLRERARLIDRAFQLGEAALPTLLLALSAAAQADAALARQDAELGLAWARLDQALGYLP